MRVADAEERPVSTASGEALAENRDSKRRNRLLEQENEVLRRAAAYLAKARCRGILYPLVKELAATDAPLRVPVAVSCRVLKLHRQHYYAWLAQPVTDRAYLAHSEGPEFGYRLLFDEVTAAGHQVCERTVWKIASANQWWCVFGKKRRGKKHQPSAAAHDDRVRREFSAAGPNLLWLTDITEHPTMEGKLYMCAVKDVWSNRIVGYSIDSRMTSQLAVNALESAVARRGAGGGSVAGCVLHSDRGGQFRSRKLQQSLWRHQMLGSMGQVGSAGDNAAMESFFALLQKTCSTVAAGSPARNSGSRSWPGPSGPITADDANLAWVDCPPASTKP